MIMENLRRLNSGDGYEASSINFRKNIFIAQDLTNKKGFTLIELIITIAIIGILAACALSLFLNFILKAKTAEARANLGAIRSCEEAYWAENTEYRICNPSPRPLAQVNASRATWQDNGGFRAIGFQPSGKVYYSYAVWVNDLNYRIYSILAVGDLDEDRRFGMFRFTNTNPTIMNLAQGEY